MLDARSLDTLTNEIFDGNDGKDLQQRNSETAFTGYLNSNLWLMQKYEVVVMGRKIQRQIFGMDRPW